MKGDFSRDSFDAKKHFLRVLMQQGRVQLDADWNEQTSILLHYLQNLAADLIGPHGGPKDNCGFRVTSRLDQKDDEITDTKKYKEMILSDLELKDSKPIEDSLSKGDFLIGPGHYYVNGVLCENEHFLFYKKQPGYPFPESIDAEKIKARLGEMMVYLDVWERHMAWFEEPKDIAPGMREPALGGPDTATRSRLVWQVKVYEPVNSEKIKKNCSFIKTIEERFQPKNRGSLRALAQKSNKSDKNPCIIPPRAQYRGLENQLYRVEVHKSGEAGEATFKWSRENGSVVFPIVEGTISITEDSVKATLSHLGLDERYGLKIGNWVDFVDEDSILQNQAYPLLKVKDIDHNAKEVTLIRKTDEPGIVEMPFRQPFLRRWDQFDTKSTKIEKDGSILIEESEDGNKLWLDLEQGIQIQFQKAADKAAKHHYRTGDYWLIPARTATGDVQWPKVGEEPIALPPHGIEHHYAPLAKLSKSGDVIDASNCRNCFS